MLERDVRNDRQNDRAVVVGDIVVGHVVGVEDVVEKNVVPSEVFELETV